MKVLYIEWISYGREDIKEAIVAEGHQLVCFPFVFAEGRLRHDRETEERLQTVLHKEVPDMVFSTDYFPVISKVCQKERIRYISWSYDCPYVLLYSSTIVNPCNRIYVFDKGLYSEFHHAGISTVRYMPLAANTKRLDTIHVEPPFVYDISFVGSLYVEKGTSFDQMIDALPGYARGYIEALMAAQLKTKGADLIQGSLAPVIEDLYRAFPMDPLPDGVETREYLYADHVIKQRITAIERIDLLDAIAQVHPVDLFTHMKDFSLPGLRNHGAVDHVWEMPQVFKQSKIDLNITLRSIKSGIPLRAFDIMGAGGFLLSDLQMDLLDLFVPGEDFVYYEDKGDLVRKVDYYLRHEEERQAIAKNGHDKVAASHTYRHRIREMFDRCD